MLITFYKYHGAGNDFIVIDNRKLQLGKDNVSMVKMLCNRHTGIGADGLMLLNDSDTCDFEMIYFNADGREGSLCGNGSRCIIAFAQFLGIIGTPARFMAVDGVHEAQIINEEIVHIKLNDVTHIQTGDGYFFIDNGSPHYVSFHKDIEAINVIEKGKEIRWSEEFQPEGTNVNFVQQDGNHLTIRTYERGVENETLACGTGITAAAIAAFLKSKNKKSSFEVTAKGGTLNVSFEQKGDVFTNIWLEGPVKQVFKGEINV